jgi:hypothetical protein
MKNQFYFRNRKVAQSWFDHLCEQDTNTVWWLFQHFNERQAITWFEVTTKAPF